MQRKLRTILTVLLSGILLYTLAGFFLAPQLVKRWIGAVVTTDSGRRLASERVTFNPYTFEVSFTNLTLYGRENKAILSIGRSTAILALRSVREQRPVFSGTVELIDVEAGPQGSGQSDLTIPRITADSAALSPGAVIAERIHLDRPEMHMRRNRNGELDVPAELRQLLANPAAGPLAFSAIDIDNGRVQFVDHAVTPTVRFAADIANARIETRDAGGAISTAATVRGRLIAAGGGEVEAAWRRVHGTRDAEFSVTASGVALPLVSPYAAEIAGTSLAGGRFDLDFDIQHADGRVTADLRFSAEGLELAAAGSDRAADARPVDLAVALLEDRAGSIRIARSLERSSAGGALEPGRSLSRMLGRALEDAARNPFEVLGRLAGEPPTVLSRLEFLPGSAELDVVSRGTLDALATVLDRRPRLALVIHPAYDPVADGEALARQQVRLHVVLAASARPPAQADDAPPDFGDEKVQAVLDEFAATRLPERSRRALAEATPGRDETYYRAVFEALVANLDVDDAQLRRLARYRVQSATGELARRGVDAGRLLRHDTIDVRAGGTSRIRVEIEPVPAASVSTTSEPGAGG